MRRTATPGCLAVTIALVALVVLIVLCFAIVFHEPLPMDFPDRVAHFATSTSSARAVSPATMRTDG